MKANSWPGFLPHWHPANSGLPAADPGSWKVKISNSKVVKFVPGGNKGSWIANPGLVPMQPGSATVTIYNSKKSYAIKVLISS